MPDYATQNTEKLKENSTETPERQRADLALDVREERIEKTVETKTLSDWIEEIDSERPISEQIKEMEKLKNILKPLLIKAYTAEETEENLKKSPLLIQKYTTNELEKAATEKWAEIYTDQPQNAQEWWDELRGDTEETYKEAKKEKENVEKRETPNKTEWMSSSVKWGLIAAGALGIWELYDYFTDKKEDKNASKLLVGSALTAMGVGAMIAPELIGKWSAMYLNLDITNKGIGDFWDNMKKGEVLDAFKSLNFETNSPGLNEVTEKLAISKKTVIELKDITWGTLHSFHANAKRNAKSLIYDGLETLGLTGMPGLSLDNETKTAAEEAKLVGFINEHKAKIDGNIEKMTVEEILGQLSAQGVFGENPEEGKPEKAENGTDPDLQKQLEKGGWPHVTAAIEGLKDGTLEWDEGLKAIMAGVWEDKGAIAISGEQSFLVKGAICIPLSSVGIVSGQFVDFAEAIQGEGEWSDLLWENGQEMWFGSYAAVHGGMALWKGKNIPQTLAQAGKGGLKGLLDSYILLPKLAVKAYKAKKSLEGDFNYLKYRKAEFLSLSPEAKVHVLHQESTYFAERYERYHEQVATSKSMKMLKKAQGKFYEIFFGKGWAEKMEIKYGKRYFESYQSFLKAVGKTDPLLVGVSLEEIEKNGQARATLNTIAKDFAKNNPVDALPKVTHYLTQNPKYATHKEATDARLQKLHLDPKLMERMKKLGLDHERVTLRLREAGVTSKAQLETLVSHLEKNPSAVVLDFEKRLFAIKNPRLFASYQALQKTAGIFAVVYMIYDFENSKDKWNTAGADILSLGGFSVGFRAAQGLPIPNPIWKEVAAVGVGTVGAFGGNYAWDSWAKPQLEKYFPNRNQLFKSKLAQGTGTFFELATGGVALGTAMYGADAIGLGDGIDENSDPLEYVQETSNTWHPDYVGELFEGKRLLAYDDHRMHSLEDLRANASEAKKNLLKEKTTLTEDIKNVNAKLSDTTNSSTEEDLNIEKDELETRLTAIENILIRYETYIDDSWIDMKKMECIYVQANMLQPVYEKFAHLIDAKFGEEALIAYTRLITRLQKGEMAVKGDTEMKVWQYLCDEKASIEGGEVSFADFASMTILNTNNLKFLEKLEKEKKPSSSVNHSSSLKT